MFSCLLYVHGSEGISEKGGLWAGVCRRRGRREKSV